MGRFSVSIRGREIHQWRAGKARNLFQYLIVNRGRVVPKLKLYDALWPRREWSPHSSSLKVAVHALRRILESAADADLALSIGHQDFGYILHTGKIWVDVDEFEARLEEGRAAAQAGDKAAALAAYSSAMHLYQDGFLIGESADWIDEQREWCKALALPALTWLAEEAFARDDLNDLIRWCRRIIEIDPYHERAYQLMIMAHGKRGNLGSARRWYGMCMTRLREDFGVEPSEFTRQIYQRVLRRRHQTGTIVAR
ncbi:BTAD domain-containing putative transcriptional regulator [Actinocorallia sp. B10E7]|uniref:AfsR/SARP family transcriptional regulator n=1 Tax=Actinocorallia sp. B10E7 TaxID=3153558 RepID=UPI00325E3301